VFLVGLLSRAMSGQMLPSMGDAKAAQKR